MQADSGTARSSAIAHFRTLEEFRVEWNMLDLGASLRRRRRRRACRTPPELGGAAPRLRARNGHCRSLTR